MINRKIYIYVRIRIIMVNKTISIPYDLDKLLKEEDNASALISQLLQEHYKFNIGTKEEIDARLRNLSDNQSKQIEIYKQEIQKIEEVKKNIEKKEEELNSQEDRIKAKELSKRTSRNNIFKSETGRDMTDIEYNEFNDLFDNGEMTIIEYAETKKEKVKSVDDELKEVFQ